MSRITFFIIFVLCLSLSACANQKYVPYNPDEWEKKVNTTFQVLDENRTSSMKIRMVQRTSCESPKEYTHIFNASIGCFFGLCTHTFPEPMMLPASQFVSLEAKSSAREGNTTVMCNGPTRTYVLDPSEEYRLMFYNKTKTGRLNCHFDLINSKKKTVSSLPVSPLPICSD